MSYELILRATYENNKEVLYKSPNINGDFVIRGYTNPNDAPPLHRAGIINDACFNLLSSTNTYPNVSIDTINTSNATLASEDFTISFWCNIQKDSVAQNTVLFSATDGNNYSWSTTKGTFLLLGNPVRLLYDNTTYLTSKNTLKLVDGKNHFICIERKNDTLYVFIDGKLEIEDDIATRFGVTHYPFANVKFSVGNGGAEDSDGTRTLKRSMLVDGYTLIKGICIWDKEFTPPKRDAWDLISNGYLDTTGLAYYHKKIVEYINKNSSVRQNNHLYNKDDIVRFNNVWIKCMIGGTTASTPPTLTTEEIGTTITDGGVTWTVVKYALTTDVSPLASALETPRKIELTGNVTGSADFDGSKDIQIATSLTDVSALAHSLLSKTTAADMRGVIEANAQNCGGIVAESLTSPGYVKFANGFLIQWGMVNVDHAPGTDNIGTAYHKWWPYPIKMSVRIGAMATDATGNMSDPQPFCIWALDDPWGLNVNCPVGGRRAFVLAIGIA